MCAIDLIFKFLPFIKEELEDLPYSTIKEILFVIDSIDVELEKNSFNYFFKRNDELIESKDEITQQLKKIQKTYSNFKKHLYSNREFSNLRKKKSLSKKEEKLLKNYRSVEIETKNLIPMIVGLFKWENNRTISQILVNSLLKLLDYPLDILSIKEIIHDILREDLVKDIFVSSFEDIRIFEEINNLFEFYDKNFLDNPYCYEEYRLIRLKNGQNVKKEISKEEKERYSNYSSEFLYKENVKKEINKIYK